MKYSLTNAIDGNIAAATVNVELSSLPLTVGRGDELQVTDKRVSRHHAELCIDNDQVLLKSIHANPTYYKRKHDDGWMTLWMNNSVELKGGDMMKLVPDGAAMTIWSDTPVAESTHTALPVTAPADAATSTPAVQPSSPETSAQQSRAWPRVVATTNRTQAGTQAFGDRSPDRHPASASPPRSPARSRSRSPLSPPPAAAAPAPAARLSCQFGVNCYRKNPVHFNAFAHPGDPDYVVGPAAARHDPAVPAAAADSRPQCPYGAKCYRKNPQHRVEYSHSDRKAPRQRRAKKRVNYDEDDEEEDEQSMDSFIDDEDEDPDYRPNADDDDEEEDEDEDVQQLQHDAQAFLHNPKLQQPT